MTVTKIEVFPDTSQPMGGHAIIRLRGVAVWPPGATFRISPIDETLSDGQEAGWPHGDLYPLKTRQTPDGIELLVGPEIVDAPLLEPGTPVTISVPDGHLSAELIWPELPVSSDAATAPVVMTPSQMAAELAATERAKTEAANAAEAARAARAAAERAQLDQPAGKKVKPVAPASVSEQQRMATATRELEAALALEPDAAKHMNGSGGKYPSAPQPKAPSNANGTATVERQRTGTSSSLSSLSKPADRVEPPVMPDDSGRSLPTIILKRINEKSASVVPTDQEPTQLRRETIEGQVSTETARGRMMPFLAGAGAAGIAVAVVFALLAMRHTSGNPVTGTDLSQASAAAHKSTLADAFTVGTQSPRGEIATDVDLPTALRLADYNLHGVDRPIDRAEAEFWLKKAMSLTASHSQIRWAMTQLGTLSAEPVTGAPDYDKARLLWEIAAANGDPIAMCFLGTLLEHGLGLAADKAKALDYFKNSKAAGGCPNSDEAIARLSK